MTRNEPDVSLPEGTRVGVVTLRVGSLPEVRAFYERVLGLESDADTGGGEVHLSAAGGEPLLTLREAPDAEARRPEAAGLYHVALRVPDRTALADALVRIREAGSRLDGAADHVASEALYLSDPEGNGIEVYADRPREEWEYTEDGEVMLPGYRLDLSSVEAQASGTLPDGIHPGTDVGHVHLEVTDLDRSVAFYRETLGFNLMRRKPRAVFLAGGGYHHHLAVNTRQGRTGPYREDSLGVETIEFRVPDSVFEALRGRLAEFATPVTDEGERLLLSDPDGIRLVLTPRAE